MTLAERKVDELDNTELQDVKIFKSVLEQLYAQRASPSKEIVTPMGEGYNSVKTTIQKF